MRNGRTVEGTENEKRNKRIIVFVRSWKKLISLLRSLLYRGIECAKKSGDLCAGKKIGERRTGRKGEIGPRIWNEASHVTLNLDLTSASPGGRGREGKSLGALRNPRAEGNPLESGGARASYPGAVVVLVDCHWRREPS